MVTHKPTTDDSKYFVHAPTLPSSPRRALHHVNSRTTGIKSLDVEPDRKNKENLVARSPGPHVPPKKVSDFYKSRLTSVTSSALFTQSRTLNLCKVIFESLTDCMPTSHVISSADAYPVLSSMDAPPRFTRFSSACSEAELILWQTANRLVSSPL